MIVPLFSGLEDIQGEDMRVNKEEVVKFFDGKDLDVRESGYGRWIDQKCTPDVVSAVADIVDSLINEEDAPEELTAQDVWYSKYARENILDQFNKSDPTDERAVAEYNKFYQQPLNLLAYAGVLERGKKGRSNVYRVLNPEMLEYIGMSEKNALAFLQVYITEVLQQSGLYQDFENFLTTQDEDSFNELKSKFTDFCHEHTNIKKNYEPNRIFPKVLNPLAQQEHKLGAYRGRISKEPITYSSLMYNQKNFRDIFSQKPKNVSRQEWLVEHPVDQSLEAKFKADSARAKKYVRRFNDKYFDGKSELHDDYAKGNATQMHHIFPQHSYRELAGYLENIIALTPTQHFSEAHPNNNTNFVDPVVQELLLKSKASTIKYVTEHDDMDQIYSFDNFAHVLKVGFDLDEPEKDYDDYVSAINEINLHYDVIDKQK